MSVRQATWDRLGAYASALCAVHCLLTGVALGALSYMGLGFLGSSLTEGLFFTTAIVVGLIAIRAGYQRHRSWLPTMIFAVGIGSWAISHSVIGHGHAVGSHVQNPVSTLFAVLGGLSLVSFHVLNQRLSHRCQCDHCTGK